MNHTPMFLNNILMNGIKEVLIVVGVRGNHDFYYDYINQTALDRTGLEASDVGKSILEVDSEKDAAYYTKNHRQVVRTKQQLIFEDSYISTNGDTYYSEVTLTPLLAEGEVSHIVILVHDITEKRIAEQEIKASRKSLNESKLRYQSLFQYNINPIFSLNLQGMVLKANLAIKELTSYSPEETIGFMLKNFVIEKDIVRVENGFKEAKGGLAASISITAFDKYGERLELIVKFIPIIVNEETLGVYAMLRDITEERELIEKLTESNKRFRIITENTDDLITLINEQGKIDYLSPSCRKILGFENERIIGKPYTEFVHPSDLTDFKRTFEEAITEKSYFKTLYRMQSRTGSWIWLEMAATPVFDEFNELIHIVAVSRDMTLRLEYEERLKYSASHDFLTDLENRRSFKVRLSHALSRFRKERFGLALIMIDIDNFKPINDQYGHDIGDRVLAKFSILLNRAMGNKGNVFRFGGDEFATVIEDTDKDEVIQLVGEFRRSLKKSWQVKGHDLKITSSIGIAFIHERSSDKITDNRFIKVADQALYKAKAAGRDCYRLKEFL